VFILHLILRMMLKQTRNVSFDKKNCVCSSHTETCRNLFYCLDDFYNKPWGMKHFLMYSSPPIPKNTIIALLDPDMIFLRPLTPEISSDISLLTDKAVKGEIIDRIIPGRPVAQTYGLGAPWTNDNHKKFNRGRICGEGSPCLETTVRFGELHYSVGPPYIAYKTDFIRIVETWTTFVPR
jgi:peptidyl serine alpha-galactosyltransferase